MSDWNTTAGWNSGFSGAADGAAAGFSTGGPIGAIVGGIGGLVGGLFGHKKQTDWNKKNYELALKQFDEQKRQFGVQDDYNKNRFQYTVADAIKAGVNPVAVIGNNGGHYSPTITGVGGGSGYSGESSNFTAAASRIAGLFSREARQNRAIELEGAKLDLESKRLQNDILRGKLLAETQPGITNGDSPKNSSWRIPMDYRLRDAGELYLPWKDKSGNIHWYVNPDAIADADWSNVEADRAVAGYASDWRKTSRDPMARLYRWVKKHDIKNPFYYYRW